VRPRKPTTYALHATLNGTADVRDDVGLPHERPAMNRLRTTTPDRERNQAGGAASNRIHALAALRNLGPASARMLAEAGIRSVAALRKAGAVEAFRRVRHAVPRVSLNLLWALEGALTDRAWQDIARTDRTRLLLQLDASDR
jgi:DNA transformation protein